MASMRGVKLGVAAGALAVAMVVASGAQAAVSDAWITAKTKIALATTEGVSATDVNVDTIDGRVTLHGTVASEAEKARAEAEARKISGVKEVRNLLQVVPSAKQDRVEIADAEVKNRVEKALRDEPGLKDSSLKVQSVNDGVVLLSGKASSVDDHLQALQIARGIPGVRRVATEVESPDKLADREIQRREPAEAGARRDIGDTASDMYITSATKLRLMADSRTPALDINVDTREGTVTLFGIVPTAEAKAAAEEDTRKVSGVRRVVNSLQVVPSARREEVQAKDDDLEEAVKNSIKRRDDLRNARIDVDVKNGVARLTGTVPNEEDRLSAAVSARSTPGIRAVEDELRVAATRTDR
jgi:hyperosmotically inducible protein